MHLAQFDIDRFLRDHWQKQPALICNPWADWHNPLEPDELAGLACEQEVESRLVTGAPGGWAMEEGPFKPSRFGKLRKAPWTRMQDLHVTDKGLIWNSDLVETMELDNLISQASVTLHGAQNRKESRGAHAHEDFPDRDDANWMKHTVAWFDGWGGKGGGVKLDYRPVHEYTLTDDVEYIKPKKRVY